MRRAPGFSLLELAIVMVISGFLMVGIIRLFETMQMKRDFDVTRQRLEKITRQLDAFADMNERFPCPIPAAAGALAPEPENCSRTELKPEERDVTTGVLPAAALELTPEEVQDGWGHLFTYSVSARLTKPNSMRGVTPPAGVIGLVNGYGDNVLDVPDTGRYVVISHGPRGAGGFTPQGREIPCEENTLSAKNCHAPGAFVAGAWSTAPGPYFFDNLVAGDGSRRQERLLQHLDFCGRRGKYFAPERFYGDKDGCVADDKIYGDCTIETSFYLHPGDIIFTGNWDSPPQTLWSPAKGGRGICTCQKGFSFMEVGSWELPLHPQSTPPPAMSYYCNIAAAYAGGALVKSDCSGSPPALDVRLRTWKYEYITFDGKVLKQQGSAVRLDNGKSGQILKIMALDPDTGKMVKAKAAAHSEPDDTQTIHLNWTTPLIEMNHKMTLYSCTRN